MKKRIAIYGGTELSAPESWFVVSLTHALLESANIIVVTGGFLYWPKKLPGAISTDYSVLQGAKRYAYEKGLDLKDVLETWLPDPDVENDPQKKDVVRFKEGNVRELTGESAQARRFSMIRDVDALISIKGKKHTSIVLDFALTMNKPAFPLAFTGGDSRDFWNINKARVRKWFEIDDDFANDLEVTSIQEAWTPPKRSEILKKIIAALKRGLETESRNQHYYKKLQEEFKEGINFIGEKNLESGNSDEKQNIGEVKSNQLKIFLSYARKDEDLKNELDMLLSFARSFGRNLSIKFKNNLKNRKWRNGCKR